MRMFIRAISRGPRYDMRPDRASGPSETIPREERVQYTAYLPTTLTTNLKLRYCYNIGADSCYVTDQKITSLNSDTILLNS